MSNIETFKLDNGLTIYFYIDKRRHSTFFQHITLYGGEIKDFKVDGKEYHMQDGIAHILEHYIVEENKEGNFLKTLGEKQMSTNASTHYKMTRFYFEAVENVEYGIKTMLKGIYSPIFSEERLEKIKKPVLQEVRGKMTNKFFYVNKETINNCFSRVKFRDIGGRLDEITNTTIDDLKLCYEAFYQPKNQFIVVGGNFDKEKILKIIEDFYKNLSIKNKEVEIIDMHEEDKVVKERGIVEFPTGQEYTEVTYKVNVSKFKPKDKIKLDFYLNYFFNMYFGTASNLYKYLTKNNIITTSISCSSNLFDKFVLISVGSYSSKAKLIEEKIKDTFIKLDDFNEELFEIYKKESILKLVLRGEELLDTIFPFVSNIVEYNYPYPDTVDDIKEFNYDDFVKTIKSLDFSNNTVTTIKNKEA